VHTIDRTWKSAGIADPGAREWTLLRELRARRYDLLVHLTEHPRGLTLARLLRPRYAVHARASRTRAMWRRHFTHFYRLPGATERHVVEQNLDALRRIGVYPGEDDADSCWCRCRRGARADAARATRPRAARVRPGASGLALALQVLARRAHRGADRHVVADGLAVADRRARRARARARRRDRARRAPATRARDVDLTGQLTMRSSAP
jgi:hypothetical protein